MRSFIGLLLCAALVSCSAPSDAETCNDKHPEVPLIPDLY